MEVRRNTAINFGKNQDILLNLGKAVREAQCVALRKLPNHKRKTAPKYKTLRSYINKAIGDRSFSRFMSNFEAQLSKLIPLNPQKRRTLPWIINYTEHFGDDISEEIRTDGFKVFKRVFKDAVKKKFPTDKKQVAAKINELLKALKPKADK